MLWKHISICLSSGRCSSPFSCSDPILCQGQNPQLPISQDTGTGRRTHHYFALLFFAGIFILVSCNLVTEHKPEKASGRLRRLVEIA